MASLSASGSSRRSTPWIAGLVLGVGDGFLALEVPTIGLLLFGIALVPLSRRGTRTSGLGGLAVGFGGAWVAVLEHARIECSSGAWQGCTMGSLTDDFLLAGVAILAAGLALTAIAAFRRPH